MAHRRKGLLAGVVLGVVFGTAALGSAETVNLVVLKKPLNAGRVSPMLYGGFVELLATLPALSAAAVECE